jgi:uncharacterized protein
MTAARYSLMPAAVSKRSPAVLDIKSVADTGEFEGYASLFNREDLGHDVILPGAFRQSLAAKGAGGIKMLFQHDPAEPIGVWDDIHEDSKGLYARGHLMPDVTKAREVLSLMRAGALDGLSIGFKAEGGRRDARTGIRRIAKVDLWEISVVTFPMLPDARVSAVKRAPFQGRIPTEREFERWLTRDAGLTRAEARAVLRDGLKGLKAVGEPVTGLGSSDDAMLAARIRAATERLFAAH